MKVNKAKVNIILTQHSLSDTTTLGTLSEGPFNEPPVGTAASQNTAELYETSCFSLLQGASHVPTAEPRWLTRTNSSRVVREGTGEGERLSVSCRVLSVKVTYTPTYLSINCFLKLKWLYLFVFLKIKCIQVPSTISVEGASWGPFSAQAEARKSLLHSASRIRTRK